MTALCLTYAGPGSYDLRTRSGTYAGLVCPRKDGTYRVYFNSTATRGSARKFPSLDAALAFVVARRIQKQAQRATAFNARGQAVVVTIPQD